MYALKAAFLMQLRGKLTHAEAFVFAYQSVAFDLEWPSLDYHIVFLAIKLYINEIFNSITVPVVYNDNKYDMDK